MHTESSFILSSTLSSNLLSGLLFHTLNGNLGRSHSSPRPSKLQAWSYLVFFFFLGLHLKHMELPKQGVEMDLQLPAIVTATPDPSHVCNLHHSSQQHKILNPLSEAKD